MKKVIFLLFFFWIANNITAQNVGIGTTTPNAKLHVNGSFKISNGSQGEGKVLTSDANGLATWKSSLDTGAYYPAVGICCATWMTRNLDVSYYRNGDPIPQVKDAAAWGALTTGAWCYNNNDAAAGAVYGKLYNWYAINDSRGLAPYGWHMPTDFEWTTLYNCLGGDAALAGGAMKEIGLAHWASPNSAATNLNGFTALGAGLRYSGGSFQLLYDAVFWASTENTNGSSAWNRNLSWASGLLTKTASLKTYGYSVRCVKD